MNFTLDQLLALESIARTGSFAAAAAELHKVPSAVSYSIQTLESALGIELFDRTRRKAVLTDAGHRVLILAGEIIADARQLERVASELQDGWEPELHVIVDGALPMDAVLACIRRFADPDIPTHLRLEVEFQEGVVDRFEDADGDVAMVLGFDGDGDADGYQCMALETLDLVLVAAPDHPLIGQPVSTEARAAHAELVVRDSSPRFNRRAKQSFIGSGNVVYLSDFHSKRIGLIQGAGYGWIPKHFIEDDLKEGRLQQLDAETNFWTYRPQVIVKKGRKIGRAGQIFLESVGAKEVD